MRVCVLTVNMFMISGDILMLNPGSGVYRGTRLPRQGSATLLRLGDSPQSSSLPLLESIRAGISDRAACTLACARSATSH